MEVVTQNLNSIVKNFYSSLHTLTVWCYWHPRVAVSSPSSLPPARVSPPPPGGTRRPTSPCWWGRSSTASSGTTWWGWTPPSASCPSAAPRTMLLSRYESRKLKFLLCLHWLRLRDSHNPFDKGKVQTWRCFMKFSGPKSLDKLPRPGLCHLSLAQSTATLY